MKVKFLKQHLSYKAGGEYDVEDGLANYLVSVKAAEEVKGVRGEAKEDAPKQVVVRPSAPSKASNKKSAPVKTRK